MSATGLISTALSIFNSGTKKPLSSFCFLETSDGEDIVIAKDGSLASVIRIDGISQIMGEEELKDIINQMNMKMSPYLNKEGHAFQVWFSRDPDLSGQLIKDLVRPGRSVAKKLDLDLEDLFAERERHLPKYVVWEGLYFVLWTRLSVLSKKEIESARLELKPPKIAPSFGDAQDPFRVGKAVRDRHKAFVGNFLTDLKDIHVRGELIDAHEAIKAMKWSVYPDLIGADWNAHLPGDVLRTRIPTVTDYDASHLLWPRIEEQIFDREAERISPRVVKVGSQYFASMDMTVGPQETLSFGHLLTRMMDLDEFPWRVSFMIEGEGLRSLGVKAFLASIFQLTNHDNKVVKEAIKALDQDRQNGTTVTRFRASFSTWAPVDDGGIRLIEERASRLQRSVESWGYCEVSPLVGDPLAGFMSTTLGMDVASTAPAGAVPLEHVVAMLPWDRDASPWKNGSVLFRTSDGRPWPYQPGSSEQDTFIDLKFAPPGKGKSVLMNTTNLALCLSQAATAGIGGAKLPLISIIDIGPSSSGLISLLQEALPAHRQHEVAYHRLRMDVSHAINPCDTQLGCRYLLPHEKAFLQNFMCALGTQPGEKSPPDGLSDIIGAAIDAVYEKLDDKHRKGIPNKYNPGVSKAVDRAIAQHNIEAISGTTAWWKIVDTLFQKGDAHHAYLAQRHAVPRLENFSTVLRDEQVMDVHGTAISKSGEKVVDIAARMISVAIREYPILQRPTAFDIGEARVVALDLDEVAPKGGARADKQTALMYMLARSVVARDFYLNEEIVPKIPEMYRSYHVPRIKRIRETPKRLVYDEFHRTSSSTSVRDQVMVDMREGRKWGVHLCLASQLLEDFDKNMVDMASGIWILGVGNERAAIEASEMFGLSATGTKFVKSRLRGPGKGGAPFLVVLQLKNGKHEQFLINTLGPVEIWALSTTAEDVGLRKRLYEEIGTAEARRRLAKRFPTGSAKREIERRVEQAMTKGDAGNDEEAEEGVIQSLVKEILAMND